MTGSHPKINDGHEVEVRAVRPPELSAGMTVIAWTGEGDFPRDVIPSWENRRPYSISEAEGPYTVYEIRDGIVRAKTPKRSDVRLTDVADNLWLFVVVDAPSTSKADFPHVCPLCGGAAYLGLFNTEHRDPRGCVSR
jgi:hypothetical protein